MSWLAATRWTWSSGRRIIYEGKRVFLGDSEADHAYVRDVQLQAADLEPWLERMQKIKLEALAR